ncbi:MAG TPA: hypothetical protein VI356_01720, partial [Myxococcales bacterium]
MKSMRIALVLAAAACGSGSPATNAVISQGLTSSLSPTTGINATGVTWASDNGSSCAGAMWACVNDGTSFASSDGDHTYVVSTAAAGFHTTAYS